MSGITAVIHTRNEQVLLPQLICSLRGWVDEVLVADMASTDSTVQIAASMGARLLSVPEAGYADPARSLSLAAVQTEWVLSIDADELVPAPLARQLLATVASDNFDAVCIPFRTYFLGRELRGTGWQHDEHIRLFRRSVASFDSSVHDFFRLAPGSRVQSLPRNNASSMLHFNYVDATQFIEKMNRYTTAEAQNNAPPLSPLREFYLPARELVRRFLVRRGYRDGWRGAYLSALMAAYVATENLKRREYHLTGGREGVLRTYRCLIDDVVREVELDSLLGAVVQEGLASPSLLVDP